MANTRHLEGERLQGLSPRDPAYDPLTDLWSRLARPFDASHTLAALVGMHPKEMARKIGMTIALSPEAENLLDQFPHTIRSLATSMKSQAERCNGELRGPILWSETMSARASTFGANDVFVCATPSRAYDIDENQVLRWALAKLGEAAADALDGIDTHLDDIELRKVRRNGNDANRFSDHPTMARVSLKRPNLRTLKRTRKGKKAKAYLPAIAFLDRIIEPADLEFTRELRDHHTARQHDVLMRVVHSLEERTGNQIPEFRIERGALYAGPVQYHNHHRVGEGRVPSGIVVGQLLMDVALEGEDDQPGSAEAALAARAAGKPSIVIRDDDDVERAVSLAIDLATA